jgi:hypothetical protein
MSSEIDLAEILIKKLKKEDYEVYQEVYCDGRIIDVVAVKDSQYWIIECKKKSCFDILEQAIFWEDYAEKVSVCIFNDFKYKTERKNVAFEKILKKFNIGIFFIDADERIIEMPFYEEKIIDPINKSKIKLFSEQITYSKAGSKGSKGSYFSPLKKLEEQFLDIVKNNSGITLEECLEKVEIEVENKEEYIRKLLKNGSIKNIIPFFENNTARLFFSP